MRLFSCMISTGRVNDLTKGDQTRQRIVAEAAVLFNQRGFEGCSMNDVMQATGLEKGGLYRHFSSKEELAAEAFAYALNQAITTRAVGLDEIASPLARLRFIIHQFAEIPSPIPGGCPLFNAAVDSDDGNCTLRELAATALENWRKRLVSQATAAIRAKELRANANPRQLANTIISTLEGALVLSRIEGNRIPLRDAEDSLNLLLDAFVASAAKSRKRA